MDNILYLSPSKVACYENCPREFFFKYELKVKTAETSSNLGFGKALMSGVEVFLRATVSGAPCDPLKVYLNDWRNFTATNAVTYASNTTPEGLEATGVRLIEQLPEAWAATGYTVALDRHGAPMIERDLEIDLGNGVRLRNKLDLAVYDRHGRFGIPDVKSTKSPTTQEFAIQADQLTAYQMAVLAHASSLGLPETEFVGFWEFLKRSVPKRTTGKAQGPVIHAPEEVPARTQKALEEYLGKVHHVARQVRAGWFPKTPRMAFNSPCSLCDYARLCAGRDTEGYTFRNQEDMKVAISL